MLKTMNLKSVLYDENTVGRTLKRMAHEIVENTENVSLLRLIGIKTRGVPMARRLAEHIGRLEGVTVPVGVLDITLYRDDLSSAFGPDPVVSETAIDFDVTGCEVVLVDDVIYTGRTARAAMDALMAFGRPANIRLATLVDRGHRELPIRPDVVGKNIPTSHAEIIRVALSETDEKDAIELYEK